MIGFSLSHLSLNVNYNIHLFLNNNDSTIFTLVNKDELFGLS